MTKISKSRMKLSDYVRLGRISIKARKKSTKNTVFGMAFGLILLVPMIFFALAFYTDLSTQVNSIKTASEFNIELKNINDKSASTPYKEYTEGNSGQNGCPAFSFYTELTELEQVEDYILSEYVSLPFLGGGEMMLVIDGEKFDIGASQGNSKIFDNLYGFNRMKIIFTEESSVNMFTEAELYDYKELTGKSSPFMNVCNDGFKESTKGKSEIIISETILRLWGIDKDDIANKEISILYPKMQLGGQMNYLRIDNDTVPNNTVINAQEADEEYQLYFCYNFKVVGILKNDFYELPGKRDEGHIWVTAASVYYPKGKQQYKSIDYSYIAEEGKEAVLTFEDNINKLLEKNVDEQYMLFIQNTVNKYYEMYRNNLELELNHMELTLQLKDYSMVSPLIPELKTILKAAYSDYPQNEFASLIANEVYTQFMMIDQVGKILIIVFSAIGGIIFFTNMLNLLNTVRYSVESRKNYIGVMRAIGAKSRIIPKMYIFEMLIIFFKTFIRVGIFGTLISYGIKYGLDKGFSYMPVLSSFKINFIYFPIALGGTFAVTVIIGTFFARISSRVTAYQPILKTLYDAK